MVTLPSYSLRERTSGAIYAGVPTVDLGLECSREDYNKKENKSPDSAFMKVGKNKRIKQTMAGLNNFCVVPDLGITKITDFKTWSRTSIQECILELQISMAYLLRKNGHKVRPKDG